MRPQCPDCDQAVEHPATIAQPNEVCAKCLARRIGQPQTGSDCTAQSSKMRP